VHDCDQAKDKREAEPAKREWQMDKSMIVEWGSKAKVILKAMHLQVKGDGYKAAQKAKRWGHQ
jgi:tRNA A37 threonylcarbamoyladenosine biosynthesis protein TsaE